MPLPRSPLLQANPSVPYHVSSHAASLCACGGISLVEPYLNLFVVRVAGVTSPSDVFVEICAFASGGPSPESRLRASALSSPAVWGASSSGLARRPLRNCARKALASAAGGLEGLGVTGSRVSAFANKAAAGAVG